MKALKIAVITVAVLVAAFFIVAALAPKTFNVQRKLVVNATPDVVFGELNSFHKWETWSPWQKADSTIKYTYSGPDAGKGNKVAWNSVNSGEGSMEILESIQGKYLRTSLQLQKFTPFEGHFTLTPVGNGTQVTWADSGGLNYPFNILTLFMDKMIGADFDNGLANLKKRTEALPQWKLGGFKTEEIAPQPILAVLDSCKASEIGPTLGRLYGEIGPVMQKNKLNFAGAPMAYYYNFSSPEKVVLEAAIPVTKEIKGEGRVKGRTAPAAKVLSVIFYGDYTDMDKAMPAIIAYMKSNNLEQNGTEFEQYINDPATVKSKLEIQTKINLPVK
jgi:effector-binding domain-containing protein